MRPMLEELKTSIAQAIEAIENRRPDAENLITQLQVQVNTVKTQSQMLESSEQPKQ
jgi:ABC-type transporter Mla subunit MlaD